MGQEAFTGGHDGRRCAGGGAFEGRRGKAELCRLRIEPRGGEEEGDGGKCSGEEEICGLHRGPENGKEVLEAKKVAFQSGRGTSRSDRKVLES